MSVWVKKVPPADSTLISISVLLQDSVQNHSLHLKSFSLTMSDSTADSGPYKVSHLRVDKKTHPAHYYLLAEDRTLQNGQLLDMSDGTPYVFTYYFYKAGKLAKQVMINAEAVFDDNGKLTAEHWVMIYDKRLKSNYVW